ncbi:hypothetical protein SNE26_20350 [Mucilaginibacter sp. cycad4]|uniref:hypothetical protein n=1 Tax=Mucilaginibacter sp. cycad4 TaxID=3342096 RepID=UPI002AAB178E|nr:hypothetical protein [Mucilaginibacter gossypii]WPU98380.1 hypothetical protein SNE26_20350 [Mucilaginibacter gossypii]
MAFVLNSFIRIGRYSFEGGVSDLVIRKNIHTIVDRAVLKIPGVVRIAAEVALAARNALDFIELADGGSAPDHRKESIDIAKLFKEGDPVSIDLGYNGILRSEFRGFVRRVNMTTPVSIEMEGYAWQLRNKNILAHWKKTSLREVLERVITGTDITLSPDIPDMPLTNYRIPNRNGLQVLESLKDQMFLTVCFDDNVLYAGISEARSTAAEGDGHNDTNLAKVAYAIGYNCSSDQPDLKIRYAKNTKVLVRIKQRSRTGVVTTYEAGDPGGAVEERNIPFTGHQESLIALAKNGLMQLKYDGYEGALAGLLEPYCKPGWKAVVSDKRYNGGRAGTYFIEGTEVSFGVNGGVRKAQLTYRLAEESTNTQVK